MRSRRNFLRKVGCVSAGIVCSGTGLSAIAAAADPSTVSIKPIYNKPKQPDFARYVGKASEIRRLRLYNPKTDEKASVVYWYKGNYVLHGLHQLDLLLRDYRANEVLRMDVAVLDFLYGVYDKLGSNDRIQILSGYRSYSTNEMLMKRNENVARNSLHMQGRAIDFNIPGYSTSDLHRAARELRAGGVGYYPNASFIHIDTGPVRHWTRQG